ncbi:hypothetical protein H5410_028565 [Solanum commersonii]|uniref:Uncharacterized protein n=1 Tax=Solanum commersonii TaxID=4109 RepID=A0A9J5Z2G7_SOLCO|nr:hypothetical protein H5410_028565 [Solanum commersonii]
MLMIPFIQMFEYISILDVGHGQKFGERFVGFRENSQSPLIAYEEKDMTPNVIIGRTYKMMIGSGEFKLVVGIWLWLFWVGKEGCGDTRSFNCSTGILYLVVVDYCVGLHLLIAAAKMYVMSLI